MKVFADLSPVISWMAEAKSFIPCVPRTPQDSPWILEEFIQGSDQKEQGRKGGRKEKREEGREVGGLSDVFLNILYSFQMTYVHYN